MEPVRDVLVAQALRDQLEHFALPWCETLGRRRWLQRLDDAIGDLRERRPGQVGWTHLGAIHDGADSPEELVPAGVLHDEGGSPRPHEIRATTEPGCRCQHAEFRPNFPLPSTGTRR